MRAKRLNAHGAILLLNYMNERGVDWVKCPDGELITRIDCEDVLDRA